MFLGAPESPIRSINQFHYLIDPAKRPCISNDSSLLHNQLLNCSRPPFPNLKLCLSHSTINIPLGNFIAKTLPEVSWHGMQLWISSIQLSQVFLHLLNSYTAKSRLIFVLYAIAL